MKVDSSKSKLKLTA